MRMENTLSTLVGEELGGKTKIYGAVKGVHGSLYTICHSTLCSPS